MIDQTPALPRWLVRHREVVAERDRLAARVAELEACAASAMSEGHRRERARIVAWARALHSWVADEIENDAHWRGPRGGDG
jgi:hypothetical protein